MAEDKPLLRARRPPVSPRKTGHAAGTSVQQAADNAGARTGPPASLTVAPVPPRLLDLDGTAAYLGVSPWTVPNLEAADALRRVRIPLPNGGELRKLLIDREDLDRLIAGWKDA